MKRRTKGGVRRLAILEVHSPTRQTAFSQIFQMPAYPDNTGAQFTRSQHPHCDWALDHLGSWSLFHSMTSTGSQDLMLQHCFVDWVVLLWGLPGVSHTGMNCVLMIDQEVPQEIHQEGDLASVQILIHANPAHPGKLWEGGIPSSGSRIPGRARPWPGKPCS